MTVDPEDDSRPMVRPFPRPGPRLQLAHRELVLAANGNDDQRRALHPVGGLPRPWLPATCTDAALRAQLWEWLDAVVVWLNRELVFDPVDVIPACWPQHRHLVHELAVLADLRRRAELALTSDPLEEWHRYALPAFLDRLHRRAAEYCSDGHPSVSPTAGRLARHLAEGSVAGRQRTFANDLAEDVRSTSSSHDRRLHVVDTGTGEILA
jgi:hypothetical protein